MLSGNKGFCVQFPRISGKAQEARGDHSCAYNHPTKKQSVQSLFFLLAEGWNLKPSDVKIEVLLVNGVQHVHLLDKIGQFRPTRPIDPQFLFQPHPNYTRKGDTVMYPFLMPRFESAKGHQISNKPPAENVERFLSILRFDSMGK